MQKEQYKRSSTKKKIPTQLNFQAQKCDSFHFSHDKNHHNSDVDSFSELGQHCLKTQSPKCLNMQNDLMMISSSQIQQQKSPLNIFSQNFFKDLEISPIIPKIRYLQNQIRFRPIEENQRKNIENSESKSMKLQNSEQQNDQSCKDYSKNIPLNIARAAKTYFKKDTFIQALVESTCKQKKVQFSQFKQLLYTINSKLSLYQLYHHYLKSKNPINQVFSEYFQWFYRERYVSSLIGNNKISRKAEYISFKNRIIANLQHIQLRINLLNQYN